MKQLNPAHMQRIKELVNKGPYIDLLALELEELDFGYAKVKLQLEPKHHNPFGIVHGGTYAGLLDTAAYWAAYCDLPEEVGYTSADLNIDFLGMAVSGTVYAEGRVLKAGRTMILVEAWVNDAENKMLAHATSKLLVLGQRQSIKQAVAALGLEALPPKFREE